MTTVGQRERMTQERVVRLFQDQLGYRYLGNWRDRQGNRNIEETLLRRWLEGRGVEEALIRRALRILDQARWARAAAIMTPTAWYTACCATG